MDLILHHGIPGGLVQGGHHSVGQGKTLFGCQVCLGGGGENTNADGLGKQQHVSGLCAGVGQHLVGVNEAGDGQTVLGFRIQNAVAAGDDGSCLIGLVIAPPQQVVNRLFGHVFRHAQQVQGQLRFAAHGVNVRQGVGGGNLPEKIGIVGNGGEEVHRLHQGQIFTDFVNGSVIAFVEAHQQVGVLMDFDVLQQLCQHAGTYLGTAAGTAGQLGELDVLFCHTETSQKEYY